LKELSENETNYINKEKEYFKILSKLHEVTKQLRNFNNNHNHNNSNNNNYIKNQEIQDRSPDHDDQRQMLYSKNDEEKEEKEVMTEKANDEEKEKEDIEEEEIEIDNDIIIKRINKSRSTDTQITKNKTKKKEKNSSSSNNNNNNNNNNSNNNNKSSRNKNSYSHLVNVQHKLKKEFLKHFNDNQKQLDNIYLIKELKIPTTLYKLIQESSKMWKSFLNTYTKLEESIKKLKDSEPLEEMNLNKNSINKLDLNFDNREKGKNYNSFSFFFL